jgi:hypothetical protein
MGTTNSIETIPPAFLSLWGPSICFIYPWSVMSLDQPSEKCTLELWLPWSLNGGTRWTALENGYPTWSLTRVIVIRIRRILSTIHLFRTFCRLCIPGIGSLVGSFESSCHSNIFRTPHTLSAIFCIARFHLDHLSHLSGVQGLWKSVFDPMSTMSISGFLGSDLQRRRWRRCSPQLQYRGCKRWLNYWLQ